MRYLTSVFVINAIYFPVTRATAIKFVINLLSFVVFFLLFFVWEQCYKSWLEVKAYANWPSWQVNLTFRGWLIWTGFLLRHSHDVTYLMSVVLGRFRVTFCLCVKTSLRGKPFVWKFVSPTGSFSFSYERFCTKTRFETEAQDNSEIAFLSMSCFTWNWLKKEYKSTNIGRFQFDEKLQFEFLEISSDQWNSIFRNFQNREEPWEIQRNFRKFLTWNFCSIEWFAFRKFSNSWVSWNFCRKFAYHFPPLVNLRLNVWKASIVPQVMFQGNSNSLQEQ